MKKMLFALLAVAVVSTTAFAQRDDRRRDDRRPDRGFDRVTCTIYTGRGPATGEGRDCRQAMDMAQRVCTRTVRRGNENKCYNAGNKRRADFEVRCTEGRRAYPIRCTPF